MREFEERFITTGIPYRVIGGPRFYERMEIRDAIAYFRLVSSPTDDLAFERIVNTPRRGIGTATLQTVHQHSTDIPALKPCGGLLKRMSFDLKASRFGKLALKY